MTHSQILEIVRSRSMFDDERWALLDKICSEVFPGGTIQEFGVADGGVTGYLAFRFPSRHIEAWCRFEKGCSAPTKEDGDCHLVEGSLAASTKDQIYKWLVDQHVHHNVHLIQADLTQPLEFPPSIVLAIIDLNLYEPTLNAIRYALRGLVLGGVILVDDVDYPGVQKALRDCGHPWVRESHMAVLRYRDAEGI